MGWPPSRAEITAMFDARAHGYDDDTMHRWLAEFAVSFVSVGERALVLDVAAGTGLAGRALRHRQPTARVVAVDLAAELLRVAREHGASAVQADAERLPIGSGTVDAVLCVSAAAYFPNPQQALGEFARVLKPGGVCLVQTWREGAITPTRVLGQAAADSGVTIRDPNSALGTANDLRDALSAAGFVDVKVDRGEWHAAWPEPEAAWRSFLRGPMVDPLRSLDPSTLDRIRTGFVSRLQSLSAQRADDAQQVLVGTAVGPPV